MTIAIACSTVVSSMMFSLPGWEYQDGGYLGQDAPRRKPSKPRQAARGGRWCVTGLFHPVKGTDPRN